MGRCDIQEPQRSRTWKGWAEGVVGVLDVLGRSDV
jgi:hypothetical protein